MARISNLTIAIVTVIMIIPVAAALANLSEREVPTVGAQVTTPRGYDHSVFQLGSRVDNPIDPDLQRTLGGLGMDDRVEVLVQFMGEVRDTDLMMLDGMGVNVRHIYDRMPCVWLELTVRQLVLLQSSPRVYWIEENLPLHFYMHETTTVINATDVWHTPIQERGGTLLEAIDGTGVTVGVVDTGIDAGHPDLDYGEKVIHNLKSDQNLMYTEAENTDTGSGHGTHCSGTVGGNGDASNGARRGVAPGCKLIGISTGEQFLANAVGALEWMQHASSGGNPDNIKVISNSWGTDAEHNPQGVIEGLIRDITYNNNVVVVFAAGNSGSDDHDGSTVTTSPYGNTPAAVQVAAFEHDGTGMAVFTSRGIYNETFTWPDIGAPGVKIWATEARKTYITAMVKQGSTADALDGYYMAISGTSMATPHVAGFTALLWEACPELRVSDEHGDWSDNSTEYYPDFFNSSDTRIHEAELIMKLTSAYIPPDDIEVNVEGDNGVPDYNETGLDGRPHDYAQGYGMVKADKAVALALTLSELRRHDPQATVWDAYEQFCKLRENTTVSKATDKLVAHWTGEYSWLNSQTTSSIIGVESFPRYVQVPPGTKSMNMILKYPALTITGKDKNAANLEITVDGSVPSGTGRNVEGIKTYDLGAGEAGNVLEVNVVGPIVGIHIAPPVPGFRPGENDFREQMVEYDISVIAIVDLGNDTVIPIQDPHAKFAHWEFAEPSLEYTTGELTMETYVYNMANVGPQNDEDEVYSPSGNFPWWAVAMVAVVAVAALWFMKQKKMLLFADRPVPVTPTPSEPEK